MPDIDINAPILPTSGITVRTGETHILDFSGDGHMEQRQLAPFSYTGGDDQRAAAARGDVIASAVDAQGQAVARSEINGDNLIRINGLEMKVRQAEALHLIEKGTDGYRVATADAKPATQQQQQAPQPQAPVVERMSKEAEADLAQFSQAVGAGEQIAALSDIMRDGQVSKATAQRIASQVGGIEPDKAAEMVATVHAHLAQHAANVIAEDGLDPEVVHAWMAENHPAQLAAATRTLAMQRSADGIRALSREYILNLDKIDPAGLEGVQLGDGVRFVKQGGKLLVNVAGRDWSWREAVQGGLVKIGRAK